MKNLKLKYSKQYKAKLKENLLTMHEEMNERRFWFKRLSFVSVVALVLMVFVLNIFSGQDVFLMQAHANSLELLKRSENMIVYEESIHKSDGADFKTEKWTAPNGDKLEIINTDQITLYLKDEKRFYHNVPVEGILELVTPTPELSKEIYYDINTHYYGKSKATRLYTEAQEFLNDVNFFNMDSLTLWMAENIDEDIVSYEGSKNINGNEYEVYVVTEPDLLPEIQIIKEKNYRSSTAYFFNKENLLLERIEYYDEKNGDRILYGTEEIKVSFVEMDKYESIFNPQTYGLTEGEVLK